MSNGLGQTIPLACQDWANTKAAYRFFSNPRVNEEEILSGHFASTQARAAAIQEPLLVLHDTTEFTFQANGPSVGLITNLPRKRTVCGLLMHSSLVVTTDGLPLGLAAVKFWTRKHFKGTTALKRVINPTRIPIEKKESFKWLENIRQATDLLRRPADCIHVADREAAYPELELTVIHARETSQPRRRERIEWKLLTNLPVHTLKDALEKIKWYALRWKIEMFHKILKTGCRAEQAKLRTAERLSRLIAVFCILSWRVFWMTMVQRTDPEIAAGAAITAPEQTVLDKLFGIPEKPEILSAYLIRIARLGGYLARASDPPPGNTVMWRGVSRLTDIHLGFLLAKGDVGN